MEKVEAWKDDNGRLHGARLDAVKADFISMMQAAWGTIPCDGDVGDHVVIARLASSSAYPTFRIRLRDALDFLDENLSA